MIPVPDCNRATELADWVELSCVKSPNCQISRSDVRDQLARYGEENSDGAISDVWQELERRANRDDDAYPFKLAGTRVERPPLLKWDEEFPLYSFLLLVATASQHRKTSISDYALPAKLFEQVVALALERYVGGLALRIGHPRNSPVPTSFTDLLVYLSGEIGEPLRGTKPLIRETKDCRADVVAWRPFGDRRAGKVIVMAQCAIGANWTEKLTDLNIEIWKRYFDFAHAPVRAFAIPYLEPDEGRWATCGLDGGIALDRLRIVELLRRFQVPSTVRMSELRQLKQSVVGWSRGQIRRVPWDT